MCIHVCMRSSKVKVMQAQQVVTGQPCSYCSVFVNKDFTILLLDVNLYYSGDELMTTELLFNGVFNDLTPEQAAALLSCFVFEEKGGESPKLYEQLAGPLRLLQVCSFN